MPLAAGTRVGAYEVVSAIGAGGMGEVYRARDHRLGRDVALKILPQAFAQNPDRLARFEREAKTLAALNHPNIAAIYGIEESAGLRALVMELVPGRTLDDVIRTAFDARRSKFDVNEPMSIARSIAEALEAAHDAGVIHRDLKPANIKVRDDGVVKVLDFGLAKSADAFGSSQPEAATLTSPAMTEAGVILGTAAYMSPEQARGKPVDKRADVWAFGVVLYELLSGKRLFDGETISDVVAAVLTRPIDLAALPADTPPRVRELVARCLERDPKRRLRDIGEARIVLESPEGAPSSRPIDSSMPGSVPAAHSATDRPGEQPARSTLFSWPAVVIVGLIVFGYLGWAQLNRTPAASSSGARAADGTSPASGAVHLALKCPARHWPMRGCRQTVGRSHWRDAPASCQRASGSNGSIDLRPSRSRSQASPATRRGRLTDASWRSSPHAVWLPFVSTTESCGRSRPKPSISQAGDQPARFSASVTTACGFSMRQPGKSPTRATCSRSIPSSCRTGAGSCSPDGKDVGQPRRRVPCHRSTRQRFAERYWMVDRSSRTRAGTSSSCVTAPSSRSRSTPIAGNSAARRKRSSMACSTLFRTALPTFDAAADTIVYATHDPDDAPVWVDRKGIEASTMGSPGLYNMVKISPDGRRAMIYQLDRRLGTGDLWLRDLTRQTLTRLTNDEFSERRVVWSPDGRSIVYSSDREGPPDVYVLEVDRGRIRAARLSQPDG